jgi:hypothetical protein
MIGKTVSMFEEDLALFRHQDSAGAPVFRCRMIQASAKVSDDLVIAHPGKADFDANWGNAACSNRQTPHKQQIIVVNLLFGDPYQWHATFLSSDLFCSYRSRWRCGGSLCQDVSRSDPTLLISLDAGRHP